MKKRTDSRGYWLRAIALTVVASAVGAAAQPAPHADVVTGAQQEASAELIHLTTGTLRIRPCEGDIARVTYVPGPTIPDLSNPALPDSACSPAAFTVQRPAGGIEIVAEGLRIEVNKNSGAVRFSDAQGKPMLAESDWPFPRNVTDTVTDG